MNLTRRSLLICCVFVFALALSACGKDTGTGNNDNNGGQDADAQADAGDDDVVEDVVDAEDAEEDVTDGGDEDVSDAEGDVEDAVDDVSDAEDDAADAEGDAADAEDDAADAEQAVCGDGVVEGDEVCDGDALNGQTCSDEGFVSGDLACNDTCDGYVTTACTNCGNDTLDGSEECDGTALDGETCSSQGFDSGTLSCAADCTFDTSACTSATCGNDTIEGTEECDGTNLDGETCSSRGFVDGTLACSNCQFDESSCSTCGDDTVDSGETCDGSDLDGETCESQGFDGGTLACGSACGSFDTSGCFDNPTPGGGALVITEVMQNPDALNDSEGEYFEFLNHTGTQTYNLNGCQITGKAGESSLDITSDLMVAPGEFITVARSTTPGFTPDLVLSGLTLANSSDRLGIECPDGAGSTVVVDEVSWDNGDTFPDPTGASMNLTDDASATDPAENDNGYWWCTTKNTDLGNGDLGTPGSANELCPTAAIDWCKLQYPTSLTAPEGTMETYYGRLYVQGVTDQDTNGNDPREFIEAQVGYGPDGTDPQTNANWVWIDAEPNPGWAPGGNNNDEYQSTIALPPSSGSPYDTAYRFTGNYGRTWSFCDTVDNNYDINEAGSLTTTPGASAANFYFSEYIEGSSLNKALEIYNPDTAPADLSACVINFYANGSTTATSTITPPAPTPVAGGTAYSFCDSGVDSTYTASCDNTSFGLPFNGNDAIELVCGGQTMDVIGQIGDDPGSGGWTGGGISTSEQTLRRKCSVTTGDTDGTDAFDPSVEWDGFAQDNFSDLGDYTCP